MGCMESGTGGRLLVATPQITEGVFARSVILMLEHDETGAQGVILNRPLESGVDAILPGWQLVASEPSAVFQGGPVGLDSAIGLVRLGSQPAAADGIRMLFDGIGVVDLDADPDVVAPLVCGMRVFVGYAGWSPGQLDGELTRGSWFVVDALTDDAFTLDPRHLWRVVLRRQPSGLALLSTLPANPEAN